jgi:hypothetical protein
VLDKPKSEVYSSGGAGLILTTSFKPAGRRRDFRALFAHRSFEKFKISSLGISKTAFWSLSMRIVMAVDQHARIPRPDPRVALQRIHEERTRGSFWLSDKVSVLSPQCLSRFLVRRLQIRCSSNTSLCDTPEVGSLSRDVEGTIIKRGLDRAVTQKSCPGLHFFL